ncbi:hypothetical protein ACFLV6_01630 [Chloroflexota bacterium]
MRPSSLDYGQRRKWGGAGALGAGGNIGFTSETNINNVLPLFQRHLTVR